MGARQSTSIWVWIFLLLILAAFAAFILFLDQKVVTGVDKTSTASQSQQKIKKPVIDFYSILPQREVEITMLEEDQAGIENPTINKEASSQSILQVGSFQNAGDADSLKAQLAFFGLEAKVKSAQVKDDTWYRVQIGPFASNSKLSQAKNMLIENDYHYIEKASQ